MDLYQQYIHKSRYARFLPEENRRESWPETIDRYIEHWRSRLDEAQIDEQELLELGRAIEDMEVMPSMRALMTAGPALERDNVAGFNCSYLVVDSPRAFDELMYILLCGTGVGYSVERQYINQLPVVAEEFHDTETTIVVADSKIGWAKALRELIGLLYAGQRPNWDMSRVRPEGAPLKTFGGRASGPEPLERLFRFATEVFQGAKGRRLSSMECHDLCCKIAESVVVGGVRRSALISLSNPSDGRLRSAKSGQWWVDNGQRALANNSACYTERPEFDFFLDEMRALYESKSGERGVFSRQAAQQVAARNGRREADWDFGTNPCSEIILRPNQFCNLSEVVVRPEDTLETLKAKVRKAAILGTLQATLTDFRYLRKVWQTNTEEEALLGVSLTGIEDHSILSGGAVYGLSTLSEWLKELKEVAIETNAVWADKLGIKPAAAITCVKPSGTVSQLVDSASGIHPRFAPYYIRTVRNDKKDPVSDALIAAGVPHETSVTSESDWVFSFPRKSPEGAVCADQRGAMEQLKLWEVYQDFWCEHKPSMTVYYTDEEFLDVMGWVWKNFDKVSGISFLPYSDHTYEQAPYQPISKEEYEALEAQMPESIDWDSMVETMDTTTGSQEFACVGNNCELPV